MKYINVQSMKYDALKLMIRPNVVAVVSVVIVSIISKNRIKVFSIRVL